MIEGKLKRVALKSVKEGGAILMQHFGKVKSIDYKGVINLVTEADRQSEQRIINIIKDKYPDHRILAEETGDSGESSPFKWIIDPLDGTTNYAHTYPCFCVSLAIEHEGELIYGIVYDPVREELFIAEKGKGSYLNGKMIKVSQTDELNHSLLCTGFPYDVRDDIESNTLNFRNFLTKSQAVRRDGSAALDLCYVAAGRFDGFWEQKLFPWDVAAGGLLVTEAGGKLTNFTGGIFSIYDKEIVASNGLIHDQMVEALNG
ncbi:MAG: inositol monophosphatase [Deltaproteobacteria bacterium]|nr:inositol monophosphatase [Deltaproteobacteria bacterium]